MDHIMIVKCIGPVASEWALLAESTIHLVFHASLLKKATPQPLPPMLSKDLELQVFPAAVQVVRKNWNDSVEVLI